MRAEFVGRANLLPGRSPRARARLDDALDVLTFALEAVDPARAVADALVVDRVRRRLDAGGQTYDLASVDRVLIIGAGKAAAPMAQAACYALGDALCEGAVVVKYGHGTPGLDSRVALYEAGHPVPDEAGIAGTRAIARLCATARPRDLVVALVSGGASALLEIPVDGVSLEDLRALTERLLRAGVPIDEMNVVRKHLSLVKGGRLAALAAPAATLGLVLSDVIGSPLDAIASGPTSADPSTFDDALEVLVRRGLIERAPRSVVEHLRLGAAGAREETLKPGDPRLARVRNVLIADNGRAVAAALSRARELGYDASVVTTTLSGEAREVGAWAASLARDARARVASRPRPVALIAGGETTVTVHGNGRGGRNQELALAAALALEGVERILVVALATDGTDGPTDAAGAVVDGLTCVRSRAAGLEPRDFLARNDAYGFFSAAGDLLHTGPTRTNVCDLLLVLAW